MQDPDRLELRLHLPLHNNYCRPADCNNRHLVPIRLLSDHNMRSKNWRIGTSSSVPRNKTVRGSTQSWLDSWPEIATTNDDEDRDRGVLMIVHQNEMKMNSEWMSREMMKMMLMMERVREREELEPALKRQARDTSPPIQSHRHIPLTTSSSSSFLSLDSSSFPRFNRPDRPDHTFADFFQVSLLDSVDVSRPKDQVRHKVESKLEQV